MRRISALSRLTQAERRQAEYTIKCRAIAFSRFVDMCNANRAPLSSRYDAATYLSIGRQCLEHWRREWRRGELAPYQRGRPETKSSHDVHDKTLELLERLGPSISAVTLRHSFPSLGANEARRILGDFRNKCKSGMRAEVNALHWLRPGTIWSMDHMEPPSSVDGEYPYVLVVRDLSSRFQLLALPQYHPSDIAVADALEALFIQHGAPLVLKSDNGGSFTGMETQAVLKRWGVQQLLSPPYFPRYNGAIEAGIGQLKTRTHIIASQHNRPGRWTADDIEGARLLANRTLRPWGRGGPTPEKRWNSRKRIENSDRIRLYQLTKENQLQFERNLPSDFWERHEYQACFKIVDKSNEEPEWVGKWNWQMRGEPSAAANTTDTLQNNARQRNNQRIYYRKIGRRSLTDAMVAMGLLVIRKRVIPLPIKRVMRLMIS